MSEIQKDLVLGPNEFSYLLDETKGHISCLVGPMKMSLSQSDKLVVFDTTSKSFLPVTSMDRAKNLFKIIPENWYAILKNPTSDGRHPAAGMSNMLPENIQVGKKVNLRGPLSFALYPGQMATVIKGHSLRSNQYLLARVYEAEEANKTCGTTLDADGNPVKIKEAGKYINGQLLVIKGTEVAFYIPPTGIEVIPVDNDPTKGYIRDAVTLERLEYCILKDEDGEKVYAHGPAVVFPEPTQTFVSSPKGGYIFRAIELSPISGIYIKVIAEYTDEHNVVHPVGEEQFITGNDQMIYYPRPEHALITYDGKIIHHAIAIPEGEGRYVMNRLNGKITTIYGPIMYLPDPRTEVIVKRKLSDKECKLWYPGNAEALAYNQSLNEKSVERAATKTVSYDNLPGTITTMSCNNNMSTSSMAWIESNASLSRGTSYTKPRTVTLDTKYEGVVSLNIWTGYAINVISKNGDRKVMCGPQTVLLDYDQTLEILQLSTGTPKKNDHLLYTVYLRHENNKVTDIIDIETKDFVKASIKVSYCVDFDDNYQGKWFSIDNYVKYMCDRERSLIKRAVKQYTIEELYQNYSIIIHDIAIDIDNNAHEGRFFPENGMFVKDCEVLAFNINDEFADLFDTHQREIVEKNLQLTAAEARAHVAEALSVAQRKEAEVSSEAVTFRMQLQQQEADEKLRLQSEINRKKEAEALAAKQAELDLQPLLDKISTAELERTSLKQQNEIDFAKEKNAIETAKRDAYAATVERIMKSITPGLVEALTAKANADLAVDFGSAIAPYALAKDESAADVVNTLLRGSSLENIVKKVIDTEGGIDNGFCFD